MRGNTFHIRIFSLLLFVCLNMQTKQLNAQFYNGSQTTFGQNRVQYDDFDWQFYRFDRFETYFYTGGKPLAEHTAKYVNIRIPKLEKFLDYYLDERIQFIIYNKQSHFRQSNIGLSTTEGSNIGGVTRIVGSKVFIYFDGDYASFERQIDAGVLKVLIYQMLYGGNWKEVLRNSALLNLPEWYLNGLISYLTDPNNPRIHAQLKDGILSNNFQKFNALSIEEAAVAGHGLWQYIDETYGKHVISNILYMTKVSREINDGFALILGAPLEDLYKEWFISSQRKYNEEEDLPAKTLGDPLSIKIRKNRRYQNFSSDSSARFYAYTTNQLGKYKIYLYDQVNDKRIKIYKGERKLDRIQDYSFPIVKWHPSGRSLTFITEKKGDIFFFSYNLENRSLNGKPIFKIEKVLDYNFHPDGKTFIFSGVNEGQSDLFLYNILGNTQQNLTNDIYDDLEPVFDPDGQRIYFISNRNNDSLNLFHEADEFKHEKDVFVFHLNRKANRMMSVTDTDFKNERSPIFTNGKLYYLEDQMAKSLRKSAVFDSTISRIDTTIHYEYFYKTETEGVYNRNILSQQSNASNLINQIHFINGKYALLTKNLNDSYQQEFNTLNNEQQNQEFDKLLQEKALNVKVFEAFPAVEKEMYINDYQFSTSKKLIAKKESSTEEEVKNFENLEFPTQRIYRLNFSPDNSILQLNNNFINGQYQIFNGGPYINPGVGVNTNMGIVDLMENHRIYGGFRYSGDLIEYSMTYQNLKNRLDKAYTVSRTRQRVTDNSFVFNGNTQDNVNPPYDIKTLRGSIDFIWPFSEVTSLRGVTSVRNDKIVPLSSDQFNLQDEIIDQYWASAKVSYVFDNTRNVALNIRNGTRYKFFAEQFQMVYSEQENTTASDLTVIGMDFRHYQKLHKEFIFVCRFAASASFGSNPLIYYLGGVDEWWKSDVFDESTPIDQTQNYGFQALASNMRGFLQNVRNGSRFAVMNNELRLPVFSYFINRPIQSEFVKNFQLIGFGDIGTAWEGPSPFAEDNPLNNETRFTPPITVTYENINDPIVGGVGFGLRSVLLGYFMRADWAWGIENGEISKESQFIFSLSLDI